MDEDEEETGGTLEGEELKTERGQLVRGGAKAEPEMGRLVMTVNGQLKQLLFGRRDLLTSATMLDGDKVSR